ncbi:hypothetical protein Kpol_505p17 [Vanderwaltozyma polyspora DSM 70294]|uniref:AB hydrolase-1 domain-containing protein n=1 Tax=Vanderwaltozyma polyspora (strain ATCC 22028 / DSM 70294 / BCRC 21397 / CBS 2163 / NBRC 10782 / NRRL Y-8283 / UCD 57-17) TaxID=436907 RepID=A7TNA8_VANPO|nr:uncharacterized protein Kpol_505p17 [Vanderwaltozyma polyspora DSM 70294]EDO16240.1 hypothetical protein Kpol_505p17 [Vanderwaltozyma polyspora DSM 70294]
MSEANNESVTSADQKQSNTGIMKASATNTDGNEAQPLLGSSKVAARSHPTRVIGGNNSHQSNNDSISRSSQQPIGRSNENLQFNLLKILRSYKSFIRVIRWISGISLVISIVWFIITLISDFFFGLDSLIGFKDGDNSFNEIVLILVSTVANYSTLVFNRLGFYSSLDLKLNMVLFILSGINLLIICCNRYINNRVGLLNILPIVWAGTSFLIGIVFEWYLLHFNRQVLKECASDDDDDLIGISLGSFESNEPLSIQRLSFVRSMQSHTLTEWLYIGLRNLIKILLVVFIALFTLNTMLYAWDISVLTKNITNIKNSEESYESFHWIDEAHSYKLHIKCYGDVFNNDTALQPVVLYEHGGYDTGYTSTNWIHDLYQLNEVERYCTYDRPGYGLSGSPPAPLSISLVADALSYALLEDAKITGPFITIGYDIGGLFSQVFSAKNIDRVSGILLIDSWTEHLLLREKYPDLITEDSPFLEVNADNNNNTSIYFQDWHREFRLFKNGLLSTLGLSLQKSWIFNRRGSIDRITGSDMKYQGKFIRNKFLESITSTVLSFRDVINSRETLENAKLSVVSSKTMVQKSPSWANWQRELTKISKNTREWKIFDGGHDYYKHADGIQQIQQVLIRLLSK